MAEIMQALQTGAATALGAILFVGFIGLLSQSGDGE